LVTIEKKLFFVHRTDVRLFFSFSFSYFIHGESAVCTSIDVRQHPPVRRLTHAHIAAASSLAATIHVS
jgi:hypothetical protein